MNPFSRGKVEPPVDASRLRFAALLTCLFLILAGVGASRHEFWRDEMQAWLIARDEPNLSALLEQAHYEGHPPLWTLLLRPLTLVTHRPEAMQILTWALAGITIFLLCYFAPFNRLLKTLLVCNYYLLFEYGIVCRNYLVGILFLSVACILYPSARERPWAFALSLVVAAWAGVHSLIVAVAMAAAFWGGWLLRAALGREKREIGAPAFPLLPLLGFVIGVGLAVYSMLPRPDTLYSAADVWRFDWNPARLGYASWAFVFAHFPLPQGVLFNQSWDMVASVDYRWSFALSLTILVGAVLFLRSNPGALLFYLVGTLGIFTFLYVKYLGFSRHTGFLFFTFFFAIWMKTAGGASRGGRASRWMGWVAGIAVGAMLTTQGITGLWMVRETFAHPFSCGRQAAQVIFEHHLQTTFIAVDPDWMGSPLAGYLNRSLYYPNGLRYGSFTRWDTRRIEEISDEEFFRRASEEARGAEMVLSLGHPLARDFMLEHRIEPLAQLTGSFTPFEDYYLYSTPGKIGTADRVRQK